jgi:hypothetical protein
MTEDDKPNFFSGDNIAMKVPSHEFARVTEFYRDIIRLPLIEHGVSDESYQSVVFEFGDKRLWIDKIDHLSQAEIWLEIQTDDVAAAKRYFDGLSIDRRDEIEPLPKNFNGFWIANPAGIIHLVSAT